MPYSQSDDKGLHARCHLGVMKLLLFKGFIDIPILSYWHNYGKAILTMYQLVGYLVQVALALLPRNMSVSNMYG